MTRVASVDYRPEFPAALGVCADATVIRVVLKKQPYNGMPYYVLSAYLAVQ